MKKLRNQSKEKRKRKKLYEEYGGLINADKDNIPEEHRAPLNGALRCFKEKDDSVTHILEKQ